MEYIKPILASLACVVFIQFCVNNCQATSSDGAGQGKDDELRSMLNSVLEQNRHLTLQNEKLQQVWFGMEQMCKALSMSPCNCEPDNTENLPTDPSPPTKYEPSLYVMSITSSGTKDNLTTISVKYAATPDHTTEWIVFYRNGGAWSTAGQRTKDTFDQVVYTSTVDILHLESVRGIYLRLYNHDESTNTILNMTALEMKQAQDVAKPDVAFLKINKSFVAPKDTDLVISSIVNINSKELIKLYSVEIFFTGVDTSVNPPKTFELEQFNSDDLVIAVGRHSDTTSYMNITLRQPYVQYGGTLLVRMSLVDKNVNMVERILYGPFVRIFRPDGKNIVQKNTIGMFPLDTQTAITTLNHSIVCAAMGNPRPEVSIFKISKDGKKVNMATETVILNDYINAKVMTLSASHPEKNEGQYLCRATNGIQTINATTDAIVLEPAMFDDEKTGVTKNTSQSIVISCKAKGNPTPHLQLRLYYEYGPDLVRSAMYRSRKWHPNMYTSRVTLTISPDDDSDIHTVYCVSTQGGPIRSYKDSKPIYVYPGTQKHDNNDLYGRVLIASHALQNVETDKNIPSE